jgi:hypothetical protein
MWFMCHVFLQFIFLGNLHRTLYWVQQQCLLSRVLSEGILIMGLTKRKLTDSVNLPESLLSSSPDLATYSRKPKFLMCFVPVTPRKTCKKHNASASHDLPCFLWEKQWPLMIVLAFSPYPHQHSKLEAYNSPWASDVKRKTMPMYY